MRFATFLFSNLLVVSSLHAGNLRASASKVDITPKDSQWLMGYGARQSIKVHDPIFHRIVLLDDGVAQFLLVSSEVCVFSPVVYDEVAKDVQREFGIAPEKFWWTTTHTHSAPEVGPPDVYDILLKGRSDHPWNREYLALVKAKLMEGTREARTKLVPARLGVGTGMSNANINRRAMDIDGKVSLGLNPDGPVDRQIGLIRLERQDGSPIALIANYAMHGTVLGGKWLEVSGDGPGMVSDYVEKKVGAPVLYINGAAGNIAPIYSVNDTARLGHLSQFGVLLGDKILAANRSLQTADGPVQLVARQRIIETPRRDGLGWNDALAGYAATSPNGTPLVRIPVRFLRINDLILWASPVELFCEIAMDVRAKSPFRNTFYFGYTNGWLGYLPTAQAFKDGGYEPTTSLVTPQVEEQFTTGVMTTIFEMVR